LDVVLTAFLSSGLHLGNGDEVIIEERGTGCGAVGPPPPQFYNEVPVILIENILCKYILNPFFGILVSILTLFEQKVEPQAHQAVCPSWLYGQFKEKCVDAPSLRIFGTGCQGHLEGCIYGENFTDDVFNAE
jgi:hypothetical protein